MADQKQAPSELEQLRAQVEVLTAQVVTLMGGQVTKKQRKEPRDIVAHGSERHAQLIGLKKGKDGSYELADPLMYVMQYGHLATPEFLDLLLEQKVRELTTKPQVPADAPQLWVPAENPAAGMVF